MEWFLSYLVKNLDGAIRRYDIVDYNLRVVYEDLTSSNVYCKTGS